MPTDPLKVVEKAIADRWSREGLHSDSDPEFDAYAALEALHAEGWRIVRLGAEWATIISPDRSRHEAVVIEEWAPEGTAP